MKFIKYLIVFLIVLAAAGVGVYYVGTNMASEKLVEQAAGDLADSGQLEDIKAHVERDPQLSGYIEEAKTADESALPFKTTGQATRVLIQKVGVSELQKNKKRCRKRDDQPGRSNSETGNQPVRRRNACT